MYTHIGALSHIKISIRIYKKLIVNTSGKWKAGGGKYICFYVLCFSID